MLSIWLCSLSPTVSVSTRRFTVDRNRNQAEPQSLSVPASPAAPLSLFPFAADRETASRPANISAAPVWSAGRWRDRREQSKWAIRNWIRTESGPTPRANGISHDVTGGSWAASGNLPAGCGHLADLTWEAEVYKHILCQWCESIKLDQCHRKHFLSTMENRKPHNNTVIKHNQSHNVFTDLKCTIWGTQSCRTTCMQMRSSQRVTKLNCFQPCCLVKNIVILDFLCILTCIINVDGCHQI